MRDLAFGDDDPMAEGSDAGRDEGGGWKKNNARLRTRACMTETLHRYFTQDCARREQTSSSLYKTHRQAAGPGPARNGWRSFRLWPLPFSALPTRAVCSWSVRAAGGVGTPSVHPATPHFLSFLAAVPARLDLTRPGSTRPGQRNRRRAITMCQGAEFPRERQTRLDMLR